MRKTGRSRDEPHWDAIVVGSGPAGSTCAVSLARTGHRVLLLERDQKPGSCANCTGIIGEEAFERFDLPRELIVNTVSKIRFVGPFRREVGFEPGRDLAHVVRRHRFDAALADRAAEQGVEVRTGVRVAGGSRRPGGIEVYGATERTAVCFRGRSLVLAVGYQPALLQAFEFEAPPEFVQGVQLLCRNRGVERVEVYVGRRFAPGSFGWAVPLESGWVKVGLTTSRRARACLEQIVDAPFLRQRIDTTDGRLRLCPIPVGPMRRCHDQRTLVVGEAAGQVKTTSNGGIYYSMLGARAAAETLDRALRTDDLSAESLREYEARWRRLLEAELLTGQQLRGAFESMSDSRLAALMWMASINGLMDLIHENADFDWHRPLLRALAGHTLLAPFFRSALTPRDLAASR